MHRNYVAPTWAQARRWEAFAVLAQTIGTGQSTAYAELNDMGAALADVPVLAALGWENPCTRLRLVAVKAAYAADPTEFHDTMRKASASIMASYNRDFGGEHRADEVSA